MTVGVRVQTTQQVPADVTYTGDAAPSFPLPPGHMFGPDWAGSLLWHSGRSGGHDGVQLRLWQARYRDRWKRSFEMSGVFDAATQGAARDVQRACGLPDHGRVDRDTWEAVWARRRPPRPAPRPVKAPPTQRLSRADRKYWKSISSSSVVYNSPGLPPWYPGRPFGRFESGFHVKQLQLFIGLPDTGYFNERTALTVRGLRRTYGLPVVDFVDGTLALLIDPGPWD